MKVRHKTNQDMVVDLGESWEPLAEEVYEDVTAKCEITPIGFVRIINADGTHTYIEHDKDYRFRKVNAIVEPNQHAVTSAFIVERRKV